MERDTGPESGAKGVIEGLKGRAKRAIGALAHDENLEREGQAQEEKADAQRDAARHEAQADIARAEAAAHEAEQRRRQA